MIVVWIISMILWSLVICFLRYNFSDFPLALFTLVLLILSFVVLLRFAFNLSNYELAIDDKQPLASNSTRDDAYRRFAGDTGTDGED